MASFPDPGLFYSPGFFVRYTSKTPLNFICILLYKFIYLHKDKNKYKP